jgi:hypothetical protein
MMKCILDRPRYSLEHNEHGRFYSIKEIKFLSNVLDLIIDQRFKWKKGVFFSITCQFKYF